MNLGYLYAQVLAHLQRHRHSCRWSRCYDTKARQIRSVRPRLYVKRPTEQKILKELRNSLVASKNTLTLAIVARQSLLAQLYPWLK